jgi:hypothetical protein
MGKISRQDIRSRKEQAQDLEERCCTKERETREERTENSGN